MLHVRKPIHESWTMTLLKLKTQRIDNRMGDFSQIQNNY